MLRKFLLGFSLLVMLVGGGFALDAAQAHDHDRARAEQLQAMGKVLPLQKILDMVAAEYPGQVLKVEFEEEDGKDLELDCQNDEACPSQWIYELKILQDNSRVIKLKIDAHTGKILWVGQRNPHHERDRS